ncbi:MAG: hypothetical protein ACLPQS_13340 [Acidimicrobiales bacterium]
MSEVLEVTTTPWYKRPPYLIAAAVIVVAAVAVVTDLPQHASRSVQISGDTTVIKQLNAGIDSCAFAVTEALGFYHDEKANGLDASDRAVVPRLLADDQQACSYTSESIYDLSNIEVPGSSSGKYIGRLVNTATTWATSDGLGAIEAVQALWSSPKDAAAERDLVKDEQDLTDDRIIVLTDIEAADKILNTHLPAVGLPAV